MIFKHQYFTLNLDTKKVFDVNNKELHITGNAYRVLVFLCENRSTTITAIGSHLDWAKDYDENHLRQYRYKIETVMGQKVIEYKNGIYTLIGDVEKIDKLAKDERNTVLLHPASVNSNQKPQPRFPNRTKMATLSVLGIISISLLVLFYWPHYIKKSADGICHERGATYYSRTKNFVRFTSLEECLESGGRLPKK